MLLAIVLFPCVMVRIANEVPPAAPLGGDSDGGHSGNGGGNDGGGDGCTQKKVELDEMEKDDEEQEEKEEEEKESSSSSPESSRNYNDDSKYHNFKEFSSRTGTETDYSNSVGSSFVEEHIASVTALTVLIRTKMGVRNAKAILKPIQMVRFCIT